MLQPHHKDSVLCYLIENSEFGKMETIRRSETVEGFTDQALYLILEDFQYKRFINCYPSSDTLTYELLPAAYDFQSRGGFQFEERLFQDKIEKLYHELEKLQKEESESLSPKTKINITEVMQASTALIDLINKLNS